MRRHLYITHGKFGAEALPLINVRRVVASMDEAVAAAGVAVAGTATGTTFSVPAASQEQVALGLEASGVGAVPFLDLLPKDPEPLAVVSSAPVVVNATTTPSAFESAITTSGEPVFLGLSQEVSFRHHQRPKLASIHKKVPLVTCVISLVFPLIVHIFIIFFHRSLLPFLSQASSPSSHCPGACPIPESLRKYFYK